MKIFISAFLQRRTGSGIWWQAGYIGWRVI